MSVPNDQLDANLVALLETERAAPNPDLQVQERVWSAVQEGIAVGAAAPAVAGVAAPVKATGIAWSKWLAGSLVAVVGATAVYVAADTSAPQARTEIREPAPWPTPSGDPQQADRPGEAAVESNKTAQNAVARGRAAVVAEAPRAQSEPTGTRSEATDAQDLPKTAPGSDESITANALGAARTPIGHKLRAAKTTKRARKRAAPAAKVAGTDRSTEAPETAMAPIGDKRLQAELKLLGAARAFIVKGDATSALASINRHADVFPEGQLAEERGALRVQALAATGAAKAALAAARRFEAQYPRSLMLPAVRRATATASR